MFILSAILRLFQQVKEKIYSNYSASKGLEQNLRAGFTIVELLIVIVVIAILASITIVSYNGIQNRANDLAVRSDIANFAKKLQMYYVDKGVYPDTNFESQVSSALQGAKASKSSYVTNGTNINLLYCTNLPEKSQFAVIGWSKTSSSKGFYIGNDSGVRDFNYPISSGSIACGNAGIPDNRAWMWLYDVDTSGGWRSFI